MGSPTATCAHAHRTNSRVFRLIGALGLRLSQARALSTRLRSEHGRKYRAPLLESHASGTPAQPSLTGTDVGRRDECCPSEPGALHVGGHRHHEHGLQHAVRASLCQTTTGRRPVCSRGRWAPRSAHQISPRFTDDPLHRARQPSRQCPRRRVRRLRPQTQRRFAEDPIVRDQVVVPE